ncbi:hypothetical protein HQN59_24155 [Schlegelella sp. ID0723]|jgi:alpha-ketoglutarate-dependent taurine dioxygenase|uniref:Uncharacterized protein n=1 Tax=Piscinibacter koreensis TaxID=2742824 RepID=A0A7Y6NT26_9BURK|nr:hypothetical protein [Schlegelella koreensis]
MAAAAMEIRRLAGAIGAEVSGVDLRRPLEAAHVAELRRVWLENGVTSVSVQIVAVASSGKPGSVLPRRRQTCLS